MPNDAVALSLAGGLNFAASPILRRMVQSFPLLHPDDLFIIKNAELTGSRTDL